MSRRRALGIGTVATVGTVLATGAAAFGSPGDTSEAKPETTARPRDARSARALVSAVYRKESGKAGGTWNSYVSVPDADGTLRSAVDEGSDTVVEAYSVNKIAVAAVVMSKVDKGTVALADTVEVTADIVIPDGDGIFSLDGAYPSTVTVGHVLATLLTVSDDTAVRLCGLVAPAKEINDTLVAMGFPKTQVEPVANPNRFYLGTTTPRETHDLLQALVTGRLLSDDSTAYLTRLLRSPVAYTDGIRRVMSSAERLRVATKAGWLDDGRNEAGVMFDAAGRPVLTYALFAHGQDHADDFGATHPAVQARSVLGRVFYDAVSNLDGTTPEPLRAPAYHPHNGN